MSSSSLFWHRHLQPQLVLMCSWISHFPSKHITLYWPIAVFCLACTLCSLHPHDLEQSPCRVDQPLSLLMKDVTRLKSPVISTGRCLNIINFAFLKKCRIPKKKRNSQDSPRVRGWGSRHSNGELPDIVDRVLRSLPLMSLKYPAKSILLVNVLLVNA